ncbi:hypothetical protein ENBRE01_2999 [Enteropsectra breve]|nr:hypothetical protein ENBRE01_2999 [Enteropsectra breve]
MRLLYLIPPLLAKTDTGYLISKHTNTFIGASNGLLTAEGDPLLFTIRKLEGKLYEILAVQDGEASAFGHYEGSHLSSSQNSCKESSGENGQNGKQDTKCSPRVFSRKGRFRIKMNKKKELTIHYKDMCEGVYSQILQMKECKRNNRQRFIWVPKQEMEKHINKEDKPKNKEPKNKEPKNKEPKNKEPKNKEPKNKELKNKEPKEDNKNKPKEDNKNKPKEDNKKNADPVKSDPDAEVQKEIDELKKEVDQLKEQQSIDQIKNTLRSGNTSSKPVRKPEKQCDCIRNPANGDCYFEQLPNKELRPLMQPSCK